MVLCLCCYLFFLLLVGWLFNVDLHSEVIFKSTYHYLKEGESGGKVNVNKSLGATEILFTYFAL